RALWCLEGLGKVELAQLENLAGAHHRALRKEALRVTGAQAVRLRDDAKLLAMAERGLADHDRIVRQEAIRVLGLLLDLGSGALPAGRLAPQEKADVGITAKRAEAAAPKIVALLLNAAVNAGEDDWPEFPNFFRDFERYLIRMELEKHPSLVTAWWDAGGAVETPGLLPARAFAAVAVGGTEGARRLAALLPQLRRGLTSEELLLVASVPNEPAANTALQSALGDPANLRLLYENRSRLADHAALEPLLTDAARSLVKKDPGAANIDLLLKLAGGFRLGGLEETVVAIAQRAADPATADSSARPAAGGTPAAVSLAAIRALRELQSARVDVFRQFARSGDEAVRREAVTALAAAKSDAAVPALLELWPLLTPALRKTAVDRLASSAANARQLVTAVSGGG